MDDFPAKNDLEAARRRVSSVLQEALGTRQKQIRAHELTGYKPGTLKDWGSGRTTPRTEDFLVLASALGLDVAAALAPDSGRLSPRDSAGVIDADQSNFGPEFIGVPVLDVRITAGDGGVNADKVGALETLSFPRWFIERLGGHHKTVQLFRPSGDSMFPTIQDGALVMFDHSKRSLPEPTKGNRKLPTDDVWVFRYDGVAFVKRLRRLRKGYLAIISDNAQSHAITIVDPSEIDKVKIIGKAIWWDNRL